MKTSDRKCLLDQIATLGQAQEWNELKAERDTALARVKELEAGVFASIARDMRAGKDAEVMSERKRQIAEQERDAALAARDMYRDRLKAIVKAVEDLRLEVAEITLENMELRG
jgi:hypothetical protein